MHNNKGSPYNGRAYFLCASVVFYAENGQQDVLLFSFRTFLQLIGVYETERLAILGIMGSLIKRGLLRGFGFLLGFFNFFFGRGRVGLSV